MSSPRVILAAGVAAGSALAYGIFRRYKAARAQPGAEAGERFYDLHGVRVTAGQQAELGYIDVDGIKLTKIGRDRL